MAKQLAVVFSILSLLCLADATHTEFLSQRRVSTLSATTTLSRLKASTQKLKDIDFGYPEGFPMDTVLPDVKCTPTEDETKNLASLKLSEMNEFLINTLVAYPAGCKPACALRVLLKTKTLTDIPKLLSIKGNAATLSPDGEKFTEQSIDEFFKRVDALPVKQRPFAFDTQVYSLRNPGGAVFGWRILKRIFERAKQQVNPKIIDAFKAKGMAPNNNPSWCGVGLIGAMGLEWFNNNILKSLGQVGTQQASPHNMDDCGPGDIVQWNNANNHMSIIVSLTAKDGKFFDLNFNGNPTGVVGGPRNCPVSKNGKPGGVCANANCWKLK